TALGKTASRPALPARSSRNPSMATSSVRRCLRSCSVGERRSIRWGPRTSNNRDAGSNANARWEETERRIGRPSVSWPHMTPCVRLNVPVLPLALPVDVPHARHDRPPEVARNLNRLSLAVETLDYRECIYDRNRVWHRSHKTKTEKATVTDDQWTRHRRSKRD